MMFPFFTPQQLCNEKDVEQLTCPICHEMFKDPKCHGPCGHYLCESCWLRCLHSGNYVCPICRCDLDSKMMRFDQGMNMYMAGVQIKCAYPRCCWKGRLEDYENHLKGCAAKELEGVRDDAKKAMAKVLEQKEAEIAAIEKTYSIAKHKI